MNRYYLLPALFLFCITQFPNAQNLWENEMDSIQHTYFESGIISSRGYYKNDKKEGTWSFFIKMVS
ncbi:MAG: hypothetical protein QM478_13665 [Flavobacteriaceae bacterium]